MLTFNWLAILGSGLVPMAVGALWYGPLFGKLWMKEADMSLEKIQGANMAAIYGVALLFSMMFAVGLLPAVVHQMGVFSTLQGLGVDKPGTEVNTYLWILCLNTAANSEHSSMVLSMAYCVVYFCFCLFWAQMHFSNVEAGNTFS